MTTNVELADDPLWFKDVIMYQVHVKTFYDSNGDGFGDFPGLIEKLDYIQDLGVNCIWILPFYPSPLRDDGYDIADYTSINPLYGDMKDARNFIDEAHKRGLRVITELVVNHTSDQHAWFQRARNAPIGSDERNFYVWSDSPEKFKEARIIFTDTETSNWTWDPVAKQYYWHRFFSHQPDLNFDNPNVTEAVLEVMRFWLDAGVDGFRLDAIPYLIEREGTNCENLAETHEILKTFRRALDDGYKNKLFLAEANQWPADVIEYFGNSDECHMAYHFPLMPRLFMAVHQEDRHPIVDIMRQTPTIPEECQWAIFLRNHDELTLEMVTDEERDYMYRAYAAEPIMRCNVGIRRRLRALLENDRSRVELLNSILFSMPGTPIVYYGDEIGMGDNVYLGDRNGVRTPMQWSADRNGGFSKAPFERLYSPPVMDPILGYQSVNVEAQQLDRSSLLHWMKNTIRLRKQFKVFGRGTIEFLNVANRKVLAYLRKYKDETVLCVANLSRFPQSAELDLSSYRGVTPVEMFGLGRFHKVTESPYVLTLAPYSFYWLLIQQHPDDQRIHTPRDSHFSIYPQPPAPVPTRIVEMKAGWEETLFQGSFKAELEKTLLPWFLKRKGVASADTIVSCKIEQVVDMSAVAESGAAESGSLASHVAAWSSSEPGGFTGLVLTDVTYRDKSESLIALYLTVAKKENVESVLEQFPETVVVELPTAGGDYVLYSALEEDAFRGRLLSMIATDEKITIDGGALVAEKYDVLDEVASNNGGIGELQSERIVRSHSNTFIKYGKELLLKMYTHLEPGNPDWEINRHLTETAKFKYSPRSAGVLKFRRKSDEKEYVLGLLQESKANQGDGWNYSLEELRRFYERASTKPYLLEPVTAHTVELAKLPLGVMPEVIPEEIYELLGIYAKQAALLGARTAELHLALAMDGKDGNFGVQQFTDGELRSATANMKRWANKALDELARRFDSLDEGSREKVLSILDRRDQILDVFDEFPRVAHGHMRIACHGNFHLGQVLYKDDDFWVLDFLGESFRARHERAGKFSPLKDVASMIRSFDYAIYMSFFLFTREIEEDMAKFFPWVRIAETWVRSMYLDEYIRVARQGNFLPADMDELKKVLDAYILERACYELRYESSNRPDWLKIPLFSLLDWLDQQFACDL